jgi:hypothetical protein
LLQKKYNSEAKAPPKRELDVVVEKIDALRLAKESGSAAEINRAQREADKWLQPQDPYKNFPNSLPPPPRTEGSSSSVALPVSEVAAKRLERASIATRYTLLVELRELVRPGLGEQDNQVNMQVSEIGRDAVGLGPQIELESAGLSGTVSRDTMKVLISYLQSGEPIERFRAAQALGRLGRSAQSAVELLQRSAGKDPMPCVRRVAAWAEERVK